jgi:hypothetical protein
VHVAVTAHPTAAWTAQQLREAFPWDKAPRFLIRDRDLAFAAVGNTAKAMDIIEVLTAPRSPWQNGMIERFTGSVRRECLDHVIIMNAAGLEKLAPQVGFEPTTLRLTAMIQVVHPVVLRRFTSRLVLGVPWCSGGNCSQIVHTQSVTAMYSVHNGRVSRSCHRGERDRIAAAAARLLRVLRTVPHTPVAEQGRADSSHRRQAERWSCCGDPSGRWAASPVRTAGGLTETVRPAPADRHLPMPRAPRQSEWRKWSILLAVNDHDDAR